MAAGRRCQAREVPEPQGRVREPRGLFMEPRGRVMEPQGRGIAGMLPGWLR